MCPHIYLLTKRAALSPLCHLKSITKDTMALPFLSVHFVSPHFKTTKKLLSNENIKREKQRRKHRNFMTFFLLLFSCFFLSLFQILMFNLILFCFCVLLQYRRITKTLPGQGLKSGGKQNFVSCLLVVFFFQENGCVSKSHTVCVMTHVFEWPRKINGSSTESYVAAQHTGANTIRRSRLLAFDMRNLNKVPFLFFCRNENWQSNRELCFFFLSLLFVTKSNELSCLPNTGRVRSHLLSFGIVRKFCRKLIFMWFTIPPLTYTVIILMNLRRETARRNWSQHIFAVIIQVQFTFTHQKLKNCKKYADKEKN